MPGQALDQRSVLNGQTVEYTTRAPAKAFRTLSAANTNVTLVQAGPSQLHGFSLANTNAAIRYLKLYDKATAPNLLLDNLLMKMVILIPATNGTVNLAFDAPIGFTLGLCFALVAGIGDTDATAVTAGDTAISIFYT